MISLEKIKAAEDEATQAIHEAEITAKKIIAAAGKNAEKEKNKIIEAARKKNQKIQENAEEEAKRESEIIQQQSKDEQEKIKNNAIKNKEKAIDLIITQITKGE